MATILMLKFQELKSGEVHINDKIRASIKNIVTKNMNFLGSSTQDTRKTIVNKIVYINMRIINSIIMSIQREIKEEKSVVTRQRERENWIITDHHEFHENDTDIFERQAFGEFMRGLKVVAEGLASFLTSG